MNRAPLLVIGIGNPSRGDDALGPLLIEQLHGSVGPEVALLSDFQLQVEHALDLQDRQAVLFVDAAWPGQQAQPVMIHSIAPDTAPMLLSHALRPQALLGLAQQLHGHAPAAWLLGVAGQGFELGAGLSELACAHLAMAQTEALRWLGEQQRKWHPCTQDVAPMPRGLV